jgi:acyl transferase domain-containing protein
MTLLPTYKAPHGGAQPAQPLDLASGPRRGQDAAGTAEWQVVWVLSGTSPAALQAQARRLHDSPTGRVNWAAADVALSLATTRKALAHRATVTGASWCSRCVRSAAPWAGGPLAPPPSRTGTPKR